MPLIVKNFCASSGTDWWLLSKLVSDIFIITLATSTSLIKISLEQRQIDIRRTFNTHGGER